MKNEEQNSITPQNSALNIADVISRLRDIPRFNLSTYRIGDFETETERENDEQGDYIDAYEIEALIRELTNGL
jgi:hypothetical protein